MSLLKIFSTYHFSRYYKLGLVVWDIVLLNVAIALSFLFRYGNFDLADDRGKRTVSLLSNVFWIFLLLFKDSYRIIRIERIDTILMRTFRLLLIHFAFIAVFIIVLNYDEISRLRMIYFYTTFFIFLIVFRIVFMKTLKYVRTKGYNYRRVVIVGANATGERMNRILSKDLTYGYRVMGFFDDETDSDTQLMAPILGGFEDIEDYILTEKVTEMYVALHISKIEVINSLTLLCERHMVRIKFIPDFQQYTKTNRVEITFYGNGNVPVLMLRKEPLEITLHRLIKKLFDLCFSLFVIVFLFPWLFPILMLLIKLNSKGPVFFVQQRSGRDNQSFPCYKFRTMRINKDSDKIQATQDDIRITKIGAFLRRTSMDELPQFFNVLIGNMSVVGPRPHMLSHTEQYSELISNFLVRHYAKPGITGWAQVNGFRGETKELADMKNRVEHDIWYIENWSLLLDIKIMWNTVAGVFKGDKNAF
ncbi:undecaprenyl-phosphate glucose phosphotransferase [Flavobacterium soyangense]|uniref:Undecaprenyl-phosphate glucose phosphotransferase n=1 Tax=Flavobacterium soyangense TaxID=2023265 RepID=A0A930UCA0_9FLAO|nr:undecaprenyl-phosphate glucose phosphotransferase [Flavobacterium soyangense]MBF2708192.1 undecaprenyl-phosphate glucose phosphotransferase [Flavobacterium soyangense]